MASSPANQSERSLEAVIFDLDGVLIDSEKLWDRSRYEITVESGGRWDERASAETLGMSTPEWAAYLHERLEIPLPAAEIEQRVVERMEQLLMRDLPLMPGAVEAVERLAERWPLGLATSSTPQLVRAVLAAAGIADRFMATITAEQAGRGKPAPDVYLSAIEALGSSSARSVAIEDSTNGLRSASHAGLGLVALPNPHFPPAADALALATIVISSLAELTVELIDEVLRSPRPGPAHR